MALSRLGCALGQQSVVTVLTRGGLPLPVDSLADDQHSTGLTAKVPLPTIVRGRLSWHLGYTEEASTAACTESYGVLQRAASQQEPSHRGKGALTEGVDSPPKSLRTLLPGVRLGSCLRHALHTFPGKHTALPAPVRTAWRTQCHPLLDRARQRKG